MPPARGKSPAPFALRRLSCTVLSQDISCAVALEPCVWNMLSHKLLSIRNPTRSESMSIVMDYDSTASLRPKAKPVVSSGGATPGFVVVAADYTLHAKANLVDPGLEMSHLIFDGQLDIHHLPCQTLSPASKPPLELPTGPAYTLEWRGAYTRGELELGALQSDWVYRLYLLAKQGFQVQT